MGVRTRSESKLSQISTQTGKSDEKLKADFQNDEKDVIPSISARMRAESIKAREIEETIIELPQLSKPSIDKEGSPWTSLWIANAISFFISLSFTMFFPTLWPFLQTIDQQADETFLGYIVAAYSLGQALASPFFGFWSNRTRQTKIPVAAGIAIMLVSNVIYCSTEAFPIPTRKWVLLAARFLCGLGAGVIALLRAYAATASTLKDRARAISLVTASFTLGMACGPAIQAALTPIGYPGVKLSVFHLDMYTASAVFSIAIDIIIFVFLFLLFKEKYAGIAPESSKKNPFYALPKFDVLAASVCIFTWFIMMCAFTNLETIQSPYTMAMYDWTDTEASKWNSIMLACAAFVAFITYVAFAWKLGNVINERKAVIAGLILVTLFHVFTYPWPFFTGKLDYKITDLTEASKLNHSLSLSSFAQSLQNETAHPYGHIAKHYTGCSAEMQWCKDTPKVPLWNYVISNIIFTGIGFPTINVPLSVIFSKILGPRRQGTMQGFLLQSGSIARTVGPILVMYLFTDFGPRLTWEIEGILMIAGILPWIIFWKRMVPLRRRVDMKSGEFYQYKSGTLYKF